MSSPLIAHAMRNVWCATNQDFQHHIKLARITPARGVLRYHEVMWDHLAVPVTPRGRDYFHFYQIGYLPTKTFDIIERSNKWINYLDLNLSDNILIDVYLASGGIVPRDHIWFTKLYNNNIVVAIKHNFNIDYGTCNLTYLNNVTYRDKFTLDNDELVIRLYSNAYFNNVEYIQSAIDPKLPIRCHYKLVKMAADYTDFMMSCNAVESEFGNHGLGVYYRDGFVTEKPLGYTPAMNGCYLGFMWDESFKYQKYFKIKHLPAFISDKHRGVRKYLLVMDALYRHIDYHDDIDIYIINHLSGQGIYYNKTGGFGISMITNNSYALDAELVERYIDSHEFLGSIDDCSIRVMVRQGGRKVGLFNQKNRIEELYKLDYAQIINAHVNTPSLVPAWRASSLENSAYVKLMSAPAHQLTNELIVDAYGYNGISSQFANPQVSVTSGEFIAPEIACIADKDTSLGMRAVFCYDNAGLLIGHYQNNSLSPLIGIPSQYMPCKSVECFNGLLSEDYVDAYVNIDVVSNDLEQYGFRCYVSTGDLNGILNEWEDVTDSNFYTFTKATAKTKARIDWNWALLSQADLYPAVKSNKYIHLYKWSKAKTDKYDGCIELNIKATQMWNGVRRKMPLGIPPARVDVFANGLSLIQNVDYIMNYPKVVIINRDINRSETLDIVIRSYGFGDPRITKPFISEDTGFIKGGKLSVNGVYDIRNAKSVRVIVDNKLVDMSGLKYAEGDIVGGNVIDGKPYSISDYSVPVDNLVRHTDTWHLYEETIVIDKTISDYLTPRLPENTPTYPIVVKSRWTVISPVISSILHAFSNAHNFDNLVPDNYTTQDIVNWFTPFKWLLDFDPAARGVDENYFRIEPHAQDTVMVVTQKQYEFLEWVIKIYLNNRVDLSVNVTIGK